jgi:hypothetical protein
MTQAKFRNKGWKWTAFLSAAALIPYFLDTEMCAQFCLGPHGKRNATEL